jgi:pyruvate,water dikinase
MEMGGPNSHGAVVAREYGIPAVVGVADATTRIRTGQKVTLDGAAGVVLLDTMDP